MIKRVVAIHSLQDLDASADLKYWLSRSPAERLDAVELLRRQYYGNTARLQRSARVVELKRR